jgi:putative ABC transport system substrate-binding protein
MGRRSFFTARGCALISAAYRVHAQRTRIYRIGYLHPTDIRDFATGGPDIAYAAFQRGLKSFGYIIGQNTIVEERFAGNKIDRLPAMAAELVARRVDIIVAVSPTAIRAARAATSTIPIVMAFSGDDPVKSGFAATLARPGGNTTGITAVALDIAPKWIEFLRELLPNLKTVAVLRLLGRQDHTAQIDVLETTAETAGMGLKVVEARNVDDYSEAFASAGSSCQGIVVLSGPEFTRNRFRIVELANRHRLASIYQFSEFVSIGGTLSYGPDIGDLSYRAVAYMDKILKGANPAELAIEQPRKLLLTINRKSANALGLTVPPALLLQADQVIQ